MWLRTDGTWDNINNTLLVDKKEPLLNKKCRNIKSAKIKNGVKIQLVTYVK